MKVLVCGDHNWKSGTMILNRLKQLPKDTIIIHGGCRGADTIAGECAKTLGFSTWVFETKWEQFGKAARPIRNQAMLDAGPDLVIAFHDDLEKSEGTADMVKRAGKRGTLVEVIGHGQLLLAVPIS